jgi:hypothetical protein
VKILFPSLIVTLALAATPPAQNQEAYKGIKEELPKTVAPQPIPFSHKLHSDAGSECTDCHTGAATQDRAGLPQAGRCMLCHVAVKMESSHIQKLARIRDAQERIRWVRIYTVPDFVFFSHQNHVRAGETCETCHGPVASRDVLAKEVSTSMTTCMSCHAARDVSNECHFCHTLGF